MHMSERVSKQMLSKSGCKLRACVFREWRLSAWHVDSHVTPAGSRHVGVTYQGADPPSHCQLHNSRLPIDAASAASNIRACGEGSPDTNNDSCQSEGKNGGEIVACVCVVLFFFL